MINISKRCAQWTILLALIGLSAYLRHFAFFLPSNVGDSAGYQALAMKMNHGFMRQYNLFNYRIVARPDQRLVDYVWEEDPKLWQAQRIRKIYHQPLHIQPPLFPILLWISHGVFQHGEPYTSVGSLLGRKVLAHPPWHFAAAQFYAIVVPFAFSLGTILLAYLFCLRFFSARESLIAVAILAVSPVDIAVGPKLYADSTLSFFCLLSLYAFFRSLEGRRSAWLWALLAGSALGGAYLTKVTGCLFGFGFLVAALLHPRYRGLGGLRAPALWIAAAAALVFASPWLLLMERYYGSILVNTPSDPGNPWYQYVFNRPLKAYPFDLAWFSPPAAFGFLSGAWSWLKPCRNWIACSLVAVSLFYMGAFMLFSRSGTAGIEDRYLLPLYPLLAILAAWGFCRILNRLTWGWPRILSHSALILALLLLGWRSAKIGLEFSFANLVIFKPLGY